MLLLEVLCLAGRLRGRSRLTGLNAGSKIRESPANKILRNQRSITMRNRKTTSITLAVLSLLISTALAFAGANRPQEKTVQRVTSGQEVKTIGIVLKREPDTFVLKEHSGVLRTVALTPQTEVKTHRKGVFRGGKQYGVSYILRGLRLEVSGKGNDQGQIVAKSIKFDEDDLRTAQALEATVDPVEQLAKENRERVAKVAEVSPA